MVTIFPGGGGGGGGGGGVHDIDRQLSCQLNQQKHIQTEFIVHSHFYIQENAIDIVVCKMVATLCRPHCGKLHGISLQVMAKPVLSYHYLSLSPFTIILRYNLTLHCGPVTPYGDKELGPHCLMWWLIGWRLQNITRTNADFSPKRFGSTRTRAIFTGSAQAIILHNVFQSIYLNYCHIS